MNRKLLALAVTAALAAPMVAQAAPTVYGQLNLSIDMVDRESTDTDNWQVNSNSSRLGVRGEEQLGGGFSAVYQAEWEVDTDDNATDLAARNRFLGLKGGFGTVKLGHYDSPLQEAQGSLDQFDDMTFTDMGNYLAGENRMSNLIGYESPKIADAITVKLALQPGENNDDDGIAEAISAAVAYEAGGLYLAAAMDKDASNGAFSAAAAHDTFRLVATYTMDALMVGAMVQTSEVSDEDLGGQDDEDAIVLSAAYTMGKNTFKGQLAMVESDLGTSDDEETMFIGLGYDHNYTQMTKAFVQVGLASIDNVGGSTEDADDTVLTVGMQTKF